MPTSGLGRVNFSKAQPQGWWEQLTLMVVLMT
jgi:hypothetical protein